MTSSSSSSFDGSWKYDVFLSFRGEDTRKTFVDHLYNALAQRLIRTYKDDMTLPQGEAISSSLSKAIEESQISIIIFSKNYADSSWCLDELVYIMKCRQERGQIVMPVFYDVDPSDVRKQKREFGEAFAKQELENIAKAESWKKALIDASHIAGWEPKHIANGHESIVVQTIVGTILDKLLSLTSDVDENLVGIGNRFQSIKSQLEIGSGGVRMVGIWGMGGSGKTTLASSVYMEIYQHFVGHCIVENIREESSKHGLTKLQEKILSTLLNKEVVVQNVMDGKLMIRKILRCSNVLIILDDVDDLSQLEALAGSHKWFGDGSRILITSRNENLLRAHKVDVVSPMSLLSNEEAIQLFNKYACQENNHVEDYDTLSLCVVSYAAGLPLALKILGSFLCDKNKKQWESTLAKLKDVPDIKVTDKLKISYDGLEPLQKELFLDIACFFRGHPMDERMDIFDACSFHPDIGVKVLEQKALITISSDGCFDMHDLVQEMGHHIVRGEHPNNPEKHTRVWREKDIKDMCSRDATTDIDKIEAIRFYCGSRHFPELVAKLKKLRFLICKSILEPKVDTQAFEPPTSLSNELRYIHLSGYLASPLPESFNPTKLVILTLHNSLHKEIWNGNKRLPLLKELNLYDAWELLSTPDFDGLPCLEKLTLSNCTKLEVIHSSLGKHASLVYVSVDSCEKLGMFPTIIGMKKLKILKISHCDSLSDFPEIHSNMDSLEKISLHKRGMFLLPLSIAESYTKSCTNLKSLEFNGYEYLKSI